MIWAGTNDGAGPGHARRRRALGQRHARHSGPAAHGARSTASIPRASTRGTCYVAVDLHQVDNRDPFLFKTADYGKTLEGDRLQHSEEPALLRARRARGPVPQGPSLRGHRERALRLLRRRRALGAAADEAAARAGLLADGPGALPRSRRRDLRARLLHPGRRDAARAVDRRRARAPPRTSSSRGRPTASAPSRGPNLAPVGTSRGQNPPYGATINYWLKEPAPEPAAREGGRRRGRERRPKKSPIEITISDAAGQEGPDAHGHEQGGVEPRRLGPALRADGGGPPADDARRAIRTSGRRSASAGRTTATSSTTASPSSRTARSSRREPTRSSSRSNGKRARDADAHRAERIPTRPAPTPTSRPRRSSRVAIYRDTNAAAADDQPARVDAASSSRTFARCSRRGKADPRRRRRGRRAREEGPRRRGPAPAAHARGGGPEVVPRPARALPEAPLAPGRGRPGQRPTSRATPTSRRRSRSSRSTRCSPGSSPQARQDFDELYGKTIPAFNDAMAAKGYVRIMTVREVEKPPAEKEEEEEKTRTRRGD